MNNVRYTLGEIGQVYTLVDFECKQHITCDNCKYHNYCQLFDQLSVNVRDEMFVDLAYNSLKEE